jgi:hypothetical protein
VPLGDDHLGTLPLPEGRSRIAGTAQLLFDVMVQAEAEIPVMGDELPSPVDSVYLSDYEVVVGR